MTIKFYLDTKPTKTGVKAIWCYIREYDNTLALNTKERIQENLWDKTFQRANLRKTKDNITKGSLRQLNDYLNAYEAKIYNRIRYLRSKNLNASFTEISTKIKKLFDKREISFFTIYDEFLAIKQNEVTKPTYQKFRRIKALLQDYQKVSGQKLTFDRIQPLFFSKFNTYLIQNRNMLNNTASNNIQFFKSFLIWANTNHYTNNFSYKSFRRKSEANEVIYLTEDELMTLYNFDFNEDRLNRVRDLFIFQCFTGVRYSDLKNISREDIYNATWKVRTQKTHQIIEIPLNAYAISVLEKYSENVKPLPVISNQKMNDYLKEICKQAGIDDLVKIIKYKGSERIENLYKKYEVVGTHTARRTFISLSLQKGMKPDVIMAITGHSSYKMMQKYLKIADQHKREEMDKTWGNSLRRIK